MFNCPENKKRKNNFKMNKSNEEVGWKEIYFSTEKQIKIIVWFYH